MIYTGSSHHQGNNAVYAIKPTADYMAQLPDGSMLVADDYSGTVYRLTYVNPATS